MSITLHRHVFSPLQEVTIENVSLATLSSTSPRELIDIVQESITGVISEEVKDIAVVYDDDFTQKVVARAKELDSVPQAAAEFSLPRRVVASWLVEKTKASKRAEGKR